MIASQLLLCAVAFHGAIAAILKPATTAKASVVTSCSYVALPTEPGSLNCGVYGTIASTYHPAANSSAVDVMDCVNQCEATGKCELAAYNLNTATCSFYKLPILAMGYKRAKTGSTLYYNRKCFAKSCTTITSSSSSTTSTTSTSSSTSSSSTPTSTLCGLPASTLFKINVTSVFNVEDSEPSESGNGPLGNYVDIYDQPDYYYDSAYSVSASVAGSSSSYTKADYSFDADCHLTTTNGSKGTTEMAYLHSFWESQNAISFTTASEITSSSLAPLVCSVDVNANMAFTCTSGFQGAEQTAFYQCDYSLWVLSQPGGIEDCIEITMNVVPM